VKEFNEKDFLNELCMWLSHQKGAIPQDYAKSLAKVLTSENHEDEDDLTEEDLEDMSNEELLLCARDSLSCFIDERWQSLEGKSWHLMLLDAINERCANILLETGVGK
jgi:hypothetical protein